MRLRGVQRLSRRIWVILAVCTTVLALAIIGMVALPDYRPRLQTGERYGIDVSHHQGSIDWASVANDNISFAYIKTTEGGDFTDERFAENWSGSGAAGLERGAYHFFTLCSPGVTQAANFLQALPDDPTSLAPAVDLELAGNCADRPDSASVATELAAFLGRVEAATGVPTVLYVGADWQERYPTSVAGRPHWLLRYLRRPATDDWHIWQVGGYAHIEGIDGKVDLDVMRPASSATFA